MSQKNHLNIISGIYQPTRVAWYTEIIFSLCDCAFCMVVGSGGDGGGSIERILKKNDQNRHAIPFRMKEQKIYDKLHILLMCCRCKFEFEFEWSWQKFLPQKCFFDLETLKMSTVDSNSIHFTNELKRSFRCTLIDLETNRRIVEIAKRNKFFQRKKKETAP